MTLTLDDYKIVVKAIFPHARLFVWGKEDFYGIMSDHSSDADLLINDQDLYYDSELDAWKNAFKWIYENYV